MRILIILLFISFNSLGQGIDPNPITYKNLMQIDSETQFKRVMIENGYEFVKEHAERAGVPVNDITLVSNVLKHNTND